MPPLYFTLSRRCFNPENLVCPGEGHAPHKPLRIDGFLELIIADDIAPKVGFNDDADFACASLFAGNRFCSILKWLLFPFHTPLFRRLPWLRFSF